MEWPPSHQTGWSIVRQSGLQYWFGNSERRVAGLFLMFLGFGLWIGTLLSGCLEEPTSDEGVPFAGVILGTVVFVPFGLLGAWMTFRHPCVAVLDIGRQQLERLHWLTGRAVETFPTAELHLVVWQPMGEASNEPDPLYISASPHPETQGFSVILWGSASGDPVIAEQCLDSLHEITPWKGETGVKVRLEDRVITGPIYHGLHPVGSDDPTS